MVETLAATVVANCGGKKGGNSRGGKKGYKRNTDFDPNKYCTVHERQGHDADHCRKAASEREFEEWQSQTVISIIMLSSNPS